MRYLSVCSGIEAATVAWHEMGWEAAAFSEIEKFPSQVLQHHYPDVPNLGDMTNFKEWNLNGTIDILVGGTPCQSFSVAGLRKGLEDPRGNLMLTYLAIADRFKPKWIVWENVPGVLSSNGGRDFGAFLGALVELGYGFAYRVLDAQNFGVAQRRRRVFVVGCLGDWRSAAEVLFEPESLRGDSKKSRKKGEDTPTSFVPSTCGTLCARDYKGLNSFSDVSSGKAVVSTTVYENHPSDSRVQEMGDVCSTVTSAWGTGGGNIPFALAENTIGRQPQNGGNGDGFTEGGPMYTLNATGVHGVSYGFLPTQGSKAGNIGYVKEQAPTLRAGCDAYGLHTYSPQAIGHIVENDVAGCITKNSGGGGETQNPAFVVQKVAYAFDSLASNSMKSSNPHSGCREVDLAKTIDTTVPCPSKNQGGIGIMQPTVWDTTNITSPQNGSNPQPGDPCFTLAKGQHPPLLTGTAPTLTTNDPSRSPQSSEITNQVAAVYGSSMAVRRLTPTECERLQGFPDGYTDIKFNGKATPDGPRYKALGNSMAVPVMAWIGKRIKNKLA